MGLLLKKFMLYGDVAGLSVVMDNVSVVNFRSPTSPCVAGCRIDADGDVYESSPTGAYGLSSQTWLDSGLNSEVWVSRVINSGTLTVDGIGSGRPAMTASKVSSVSRSVNGFKIAQLTVTFWDAASGGNVLDTAVIDLSAEYNNGL